MKKIENLTPRQESQLVEFREEWRKIGITSGRVDIGKVRPVVNDFYTKIGKDAPYIWRCESPLTAHLIVAFLKSNRSLGDNLRANLGDNLRSNLWDNLRDNLGANLGANLWDNLRDNLGDNLRDNLRDNLGANLWANLRDNLGDNLRDNLWDNLKSLKLEYIPTDILGNVDSYWIAFYLFPLEYLRDNIYKDENKNILYEWSALAENSGWVYAYDGICFVCDRPKTSWNARWQLHNTAAAAIEFEDGWKEYYWNGIHVPERAITNIQSYTAKEILKEKNQEVKRALMSLYGWENILPEVKSKVIDSHPDPIIGRLHEFTDGGQKYHVVECHDPANMFGKGKKAYNTAVGTRTSINKVVASLKDTYPLLRSLSDEEFVKVQLNRT
jgi:hypothetical protein